MSNNLKQKKNLEIKSKSIKNGVKPQFDPLTIGAILIGGKLLSNQITNIIDEVGDEVRKTLNLIKNHVDDLIQTLEKTYQNNLNLTLNELDNFTRNQLLEINHIFDEMNNELQETIDYATDKFKDVIDKAKTDLQQTINELEKSLKNVIVVGGETVAYVLDRLIYNAILVVSLIAIAIGLIVFSVILTKHGLPAGFSGILVSVFMLITITFFGALIVPKVRIWAMTFTGLGLKSRLEDFDNQPRIIQIVPKKLIISKTNELQLWGVNFVQEQKVITAKIDTKEIVVKACDSELIVLDAANFSINKPDGSYELRLFYDGIDGPKKVIEIQHPVQQKLPDLAVKSFRIDPSQPKQNRSVTSTVVVRNQGEGPVEKPIHVVWYKKTGGTASTQTIENGLAAGEERQLVWHGSYEFPGEVESSVVIDPDGLIEETSKRNNNKTITFQVQAEDQYILIYEHPKGEEQRKPKEVRENIPNLASEGWDDCISHIEIFGNCKAICYTEANYTGRALYVDDDMDKYELEAKRFHDAIMSIRIFSSPQSGAIVWTGENYVGRSHFVNDKNENLHSQDLDDKIESLQIVGNVKVKVYKGENFSGESKTYERNMGDLGSWKNCISSIKILP